MASTSPKSMGRGALVRGRMLGRYELLAPIGSGGMGHVWAARLRGSRGFRKLVAVKTLLRPCGDAQLEQMLLEEANLASQIHHPNVVETLELGEDDGMLFLVMELVLGESLSLVMREASAQGGVPLPVAVNLIGQACRGLRAAHELCDAEDRRVGLVHRDISPQNILVTYSGSVKIADFGVATTASIAGSDSGNVKGKISYLAPEQLGGEQLDGRADLFAAGIVLYQLTVGRHPFKCDSEAQTVRRILAPTPAMPPSASVDHYPERLEQVVVRALAKDRDARWQTAADFVEALQSAMPEAFGPNGDRAVAEYVGSLLHARMRERQAELRWAEEYAERSPLHDSESSVPAFAVTQHAGSRSRKSSAVRAAGVLVALGAVLVGPLMGSGLEQPVPTDARADSHGPPPSTRGAVEPSRALDTSAADLPVDLTAVANPEAVPAPESLPPSEQNTRIAPQERWDRKTPEQPDATRAATASESSEAAPASVPEPPPAAALVESSPVPSAILPAPPKSSAVGVPNVHQENRPKMLASRLAHGQLAIDPRAEAHRVKVPQGLTHLGQTFSATVRICVSARGIVTGVSILQAAGPAIDPQIPAVLGRWRYRPWVENGQAAPFCYLLKYEIAP